MKARFPVALGVQRRVAASVITLILLLPSSFLQASHQRTVTPTKIVSIAAPESGSRLLLELPDLSFLAGKDVLRAKLVFAISPPDRIMTFELRALREDWNPETVSWATPWSSPGGDWYKRRLARFTFLSSGPSKGTAVINATSIFQGYAEGLTENHGLILMPLANEGAGYPSSIVSALDSPGAFQIEIRYDEPE